VPLFSFRKKQEGLAKKVNITIFMTDCIFCKIVNGEIPAFKVYEDSSILSFMDANPCAPGHVVVIPKKHIKNFLELDDELIGPLFKVVKKMTKQIKDALNPDDFNIGINYGKLTGGIEHLHIHIIPRFKGDGGGSMHTIVRNPPKEDLASIAEKIKGAKSPEQKSEEPKVEESGEGKPTKSAERDWQEFNFKEQDKAPDFSEARKE
jgi:histidine triad (HIT) family protein